MARPSSLARLSEFQAVYSGYHKSMRIPAMLDHALRVRRLGVIMAPNSDDGLEANGTFNPAVARGPDGNLYLFPRQMGKDGRSRIGLCRIVFDGAGDPERVERLGIALEPEAPYELAPGVGCEDPRIVYVDALHSYLMTYTAVGPDIHRPQIAFAVSHDLLTWRRLGVARFQADNGTRFEALPNKNAIVFPHAMNGPDGKPAIAMIHRPLFPDVGMDLRAAVERSNGSGVRRDCLWLSYGSVDGEVDGVRGIGPFAQHHQLDIPELAWNRLRIGGGTPPIKTANGYLIFYHGVSGAIAGHNGSTRHPLTYSAGAFMVDGTDVRRVTHHTHAPLLHPAVPEEIDGFVPSVVFPTGADQRTDIGRPDRIDLYYGMADHRIGVARVDLLD